MSEVPSIKELLNKEPISLPSIRCILDNGQIQKTERVVIDATKSNEQSKTQTTKITFEANMSNEFYTPDRYENMFQLLEYHLHVFKCLMYYEKKFVTKSRIASSSKQRVENEMISRLYKSLNEKDPIFVQQYLICYINSSVHAYMYFKEKLPLPNSTKIYKVKDFLIEPYLDIATMLSKNTFCSCDYVYKNLILPRDVCELIPEWFGSKIDSIVFAAMCGNYCAFMAYYNNEHISNNNLLTEQMDYAALFGGNTSIIQTLENIGMKFSHEEACIKSHKLNVLIYGIRNYGFSIDNEAYINLAIRHMNIEAILLFKIDKNFINTDTNLICCAALRLAYKSKIERYADYKYESIIKTNKYENYIYLLRSRSLSFDRLKSLFKEYYDRINMGYLPLNLLPDYSIPVEQLDMTQYCSSMI